MNVSATRIYPRMTRFSTPAEAERAGDQKETTTIAYHLATGEKTGKYETAQYLPRILAILVVSFVGLVHNLFPCEVDCAATEHCSNFPKSVEVED